MALISVKNLKKTYSSEDIVTHVLNGMSFSIENGEFIAIMGPSGSGKSTLLHILGFLDVPTSGEYTFEGREISSYTEEERARLRNSQMGFIFQSFNLLARTSVFDNVALPLMYSDKPEAEWHKKAFEAISAVDLNHRMEHDPGQLSGGEKQRVAIARALVNDPQVLFADEPTGNLDSVSGKNVMDILADLHKKKGHTIILITHDNDAAAYAKRIIRISDGVIESDSKK
ncbi:MAG: macrolide ABC transporter ATP-binding protein [Candidatus Ryanbacteria bacterium CG10_big_fil_rev_8_21_14_0_10_43_42]|uniref:Macrolide ABC transporter ATP-binding protein n=1 Tax=Candidatus Ryanbacteria bacterium CG10_big_fil_rev_8_21_14_0_10_43_42 TaxID=1974864 RepID=A0A2M8KWR4_9BACT|nr:MAG: macrolide ABC transporter ATP-binding protein [Candidatus Ryanbacteria bacterium CG10_big_fil_rev_8_21_14_0_10_43_42]